MPRRVSTCSTRFLMLSCGTGYERGNYSPADHSYVRLCEENPHSVGSWFRRLVGGSLRGDVPWRGLVGGGVVDMRKIRVVRLSALWSRSDVSPSTVSVDVSP